MAIAPKPVATNGTARPFQNACARKAMQHRLEMARSQTKSPGECSCRQWALVLVKRNLKDSGDRQRALLRKNKHASDHDELVDQQMMSITAKICVEACIRYLTDSFL
jgi:hypothetical protein